MHRTLAILAIVINVMSVSPARGDRLHGGVEMSGGVSSFSGELDELEGGWGFRVSPEIGHGRWSLLLPLGMAAFGSSQPDRDTERLMAMQIGIEGGVLLIEAGRAQVYARGGWHWRLLDGDGSVTRTCDQVGGCDGGVWLESPSYTASGPSFALGAGLGWGSTPGTDGAVALELRVDRPTIDLPGRGATTGTLTGLWITIALGTPR